MTDVVQPPSPDESAEIERLRQEVAALRNSEPKPRRRIRWRSVVSAVLLTLGCILVVVSLLAVWTHREVSDTDRFVETVTPLASDPAVQSAVTDRVTNTVFQYVDVQGLTTQAVDALAAVGVPPLLAQRLQGLTPTIVSGVTGFVHDKVGELVASPQFASLFSQTVRVAHQQMVTVLSGNSQAVVIKDGTIYLDLAPFIDAAKQRLSSAGLTAVNAIPEVHPTIALASADTLVKAQSAYSALNTLANWLPWITLLLLAVGVYLARRRLRALIAVGLGVAAGLLVLAAGLLIARNILVNGVPPAGAVAAADSFDIIVRFLRDSGRALLVLGLVIALGAFLAGSSDTAVGIRRWVSGLIDKARAGRSASGPVGLWVAAHLRLLRIAALGLAVLIFVFLDQPSGLAILLIAIGLLLALAVIEFLGRLGATATEVAAES